MTPILVGDTGPFISTIDMTIRMQDPQDTGVLQGIDPQITSRRGWGGLLVEDLLAQNLQ